LATKQRLEDWKSHKITFSKVSGANTRDFRCAFWASAGVFLLHIHIYILYAIHVHNMDDIKVSIPPAGCGDLKSACSTQFSGNSLPGCVSVFTAFYSRFGRVGLRKPRELLSGMVRGASGGAKAASRAQPRRVLEVHDAARRARAKGLTGPPLRQTGACHRRHQRVNARQEWRPGTWVPALRFWTPSRPTHQDLSTTEGCLQIPQAHRSSASSTMVRGECRRKLACSFSHSV